VSGDGDQMFVPPQTGALLDRVDAINQMLGIHAEETRTRLDLLSEKVLNAINHWDGKLDDLADLARGVAHNVNKLEQRQDAQDAVVAALADRVSALEAQPVVVPRATVVKRRKTAAKRKR
jgi:hypothetical protein